jgi:aconitate hydratase
MGILPLQFPVGQNAESLGITGKETFDIEGIASASRPEADRAKEVTVRMDGARAFQAVVRIDTPQEVRYYMNGGILPFVLRRLLRGAG